MKKTALIFILFFLAGCNILRNATWRLAGGDPKGPTEKFVFDVVEDGFKDTLK